MEKETPEPGDHTSGKNESHKPKRRRPKALGLVAVESKTTRQAEQLAHRRGQATEAQWLHGAPPAPEHIGHMLMAGEAKSAKLAEKANVTLLSGQRAETLSRAELLSLSEKIIIDGSSLRQIYETHLIGERGLRRLVAEYLHGGDLKQALRLEVVERERDFERDPVMRDMTPDQTPSTASNTTGQGKTALDELLERADISSGDRGEEAAFFRARARYEAQELHQHKSRRRIIDVGLAAIILILLLLVITLSMSQL